MILVALLAEHAKTAGAAGFEWEAVRRRAERRASTLTTRA